MSEQLIRMRYENSSQALVDLVSRLTRKDVMVEIGCYTGESTCVFAQHFGRVITIDPHMSDYDEKDVAAKSDMIEVNKAFKERTSKYNNIVHVRKLSDFAFMDIKEPIDFVYIDGMHTYEQVFKDITNYLPLIREGGAIGGHDYHPAWPGIMKAVNQLLGGEPDEVFSDFSWLKKL
jgi:predicted O-methyltransferase YrrM